MTEISMPIVSQANPTALGSAGRPRRGVEARVVDENDCELPVGSVGELVVRTDCPWAMSHAYAGDPIAAAAAWRNGWFHTGDGFRRDAEGNFYFVDRLKDAIRRRGENISSFEVDRRCSLFPGFARRPRWRCAARSRKTR
jgi:carnitine-CoA ligase